MCATGIALLTLPPDGRYHFFWEVALAHAHYSPPLSLYLGTLDSYDSNLFPYLFNSLTNTLWTTWERLSPAWHLTVTDLSGCILWFTRMATVLNGNKAAVLPQGPRIMPGSLEWNGPLIIKGKSGISLKNTISISIDTYQLNPYKEMDHRNDI